MAFWMVGLVALVLLGALALKLLKDQSLARERVEDELHDVRTPTLEYVVPNGLDPVVVLAALERAGFTAGVDAHGVHQVVMVKCPGGPDGSRATVRAVIESATASSEDGVTMRTEVRFRDES
jgi:hypothetical protein